MLVVRPEAEADQSPRIRNALVLPALVGLVTTHRLLGRVIPFARRLAAQVVLTNQRFLDLTAALGVNCLLPSGLTCLLAAVVLGIRILLR